MVSIRRRRLLGLCSSIPKGESCVRKQPWRNPFFSPLSRFFDNGNFTVNLSHNKNSVGVHPAPSLDAEQPKEETISKATPGSSNASDNSSSKEQPSQKYPVPEVKRRKRHKRKKVENQEPCLMRGVYFKNMKWQAAIKVDKKQIHLGTVNTQEEAAHLYDRAAFMRGREPNYELPEEEKQELSRFNWDQFLAMTRSTITNKSKSNISVINRDEHVRWLTAAINLISLKYMRLRKKYIDQPRRRNGLFIRSETTLPKQSIDDVEGELASGFSASDTSVS